MYEESYGLTLKPFSMSADPRFLYLTPQHREAATGLIFAVLKRKGMMTLTGEAGTGKTTVLRAVLSAIGSASVNVAYVPVPTLTPAEFLEFVLLQFGLLSTAHANKAERLLVFERFLLNARQNNRTVVLVVDEAHKLSKELLEEMRLLTNFDSRQGSLIQMVLAGQIELDDLLRQGDMSQLKQRIAYRFLLKHLGQAEVSQYIAHRWARAGGTSAPPFEEDAFRAVAQYSQGIPRLVNALCDNALVMAFADNSAVVSAETVYEAARDLDLAGADHGLPLNGSREAKEAVDDLELLTLATTAASDNGVPILERKEAERRESWLVRSARKLLLAERPVHSHE
jgi:type II secretory pathway predicted ATPase ExeA